jgi:hypothetical protein
MAWQLEVAEVASPRTEFTGEKAHKREFRPLRHAERLQKLLFGVLKSWTNGVDGGNRQTRTSQSLSGLAARYR